MFYTNLQTTFIEPYALSIVSNVCCYKKTESSLCGEIRFFIYTVFLAKRNRLG